MRAARLAACPLALFFGFLAPCAQAGIYKCALDRGEVFYQETPCPPGRELRDLEKDPSTVSVVPFTPPKVTTTRPSTPPEPKVKAEPRGKESAPVGNAAQRKFLRPGLGESEVLAKVGEPDMTSGKGRKSARWTYMPTLDDPSTITTLIFQGGRVVEVERKVVR
jgi:hypothetical protein